MPLFVRAVKYKPDAPRPQEYPFTVPALATLERLEFTAPVTFFVGENGIGKSTLLEAIAVKAGMNAEGGGRNFNFATTPTHSALHSSLILEKGVVRPKDSYFLRAESFYSLSNEVERLDKIRPLLRSYGGKSLHHQSHGEAFLSLITKRLNGPGLYIFDEPEAALSPSRQLSVMVAMHELVKNGSQLIIATHSPILLAFPGASILEFTETGIASVAYKETAHYDLTRRFLKAPERFLRNLLPE